jgi:hypothetical protein
MPLESTTRAQIESPAYHVKITWGGLRTRFGGHKWDNVGRPQRTWAVLECNKHNEIYGAFNAQFT